MKKAPPTLLKRSLLKILAAKTPVLSFFGLQILLQRSRKRL